MLGDGDFDALLTWLHERLGRQLSVAMQRTGSNVRLHTHGTLSRSDGDITLIGPVRGRVQAFRVGDGRVVLIEDEFVSAEFDEPQQMTLADGTVLLPARATASFDDVEILFGDVGNG